jgi:predicted TIM-barrel fold metal-dependent hydrolase
MRFKGGIPSTWPKLFVPFYFRAKEANSMVETLISSDSHAALTHDSVKSHLASKYHSDYDQAVEKFTQRMTSRTARINQAWQTSRRIEETSNSFRMRNMDRPGHSDGKARLIDMDLDKVEKEIIYCEVSAFRYLYDLKDGYVEATRAFNDAMLEFGSADPSRLIVSYQIPLHDIESATAEVRRVASMGARSLQLPVFPPELGLPDYYHERYDPLFAVIEETGLPICCHIGLNTMLEELAQRDPTPGGVGHMPMVALSTGEALGMWIMTGVFERFPRLKVVFVEAGLGWIAWWVYITDDLVQRQGYEAPHLKELPSFYFHRNVFLTFIDEPDAIKSEVIRDRLGVENVMWSSDYPHPVTSWPNSRSVVDESLGGIPARDRELIVSGNAKRVWNL